VLWRSKFGITLAQCEYPWDLSNSLMMESVISD
jgi:hypothetical protein